MEELKIDELKQQMMEWFAHMHQTPEIAMQEQNTSLYISQQLKSMGYDVEEGIGTYGMVATLQNGCGSRNLGIRAEFDALEVEEQNDLPYRSQVPGKSHLCGHDAHTTMLLGAAKYLAETKNFNGTLTLIFQPGEETMQGGPAMIEDGLFQKYPVDAVYAMHNIPGLERGKLYFREGEVMSAVDNWEITLTGKGAHASMPELSIDPIVAGSSLVMALQSVVSRNVSPWKNAVVTVGAFLAGSVANSVANSAILRLSIRNMDEQSRKLVLKRVEELTRCQAESYGCSYEITKGQPGAVLVNTSEQTCYAAEVAKTTFGAENVIMPGGQLMASEDFAFMLREKPGCYIMLGNGDTPMVHHPEYTFDTDNLIVGAKFWVALAEDYLK